MILTAQDTKNPGQAAALIASFQRYMLETLNAQLVLAPWDGQFSLPLHLVQAFTYQTTHLGASRLLVVLDKGRGWTPMALDKQLRLMARKADLPVLFVTEAMTATARAKLIAQGTAFAVPSRQLYLPPLGIALRERFNTPPKAKRLLTASTQAFIIYALHHPEIHAFQPLATAQVLGYKRMTLTRAFDEVVAFQLATSHVEGRNRILRFNESGKAAWDLAKGFMQSPVTKRLWIDPEIAQQVVQSCVAGLSALGAQTNLADPDKPVIAVAPVGSNWGSLVATRGHIFREPQEGTVEVETWAYPPQLFATNGTVDFFDLYLSLREIQDERVEQALEQLEREVW